jgi:hypothetical protein
MNRADRTGLQTALKEPASEVGFRFTPSELFQGQPAGKRIWSQKAGNAYYQLDFGEPGSVHLYRSTPGTGTHLSAADITRLGNPQRILFSFNWSPTRLELRIQDDDDPELIATGEMQEPKKRFQVDKGGLVNEIGAGVIRVETSIEGKPVLRATAIEAWTEIVRGVDLLLKARVKEGGADFATLAPNLALTTLVTGWESYGKRRFSELPGEGVPPDDDRLIKAFLSKRERDAGVAEELRRKMRTGTVAEALAESGRISFQNYDDFKRAFSKGYGLSFGRDLGLPSDVLRSVKSGIGYRHRITHVSPFLMVLNIDRVPPEEPVGGNHDFAYAQIEAFDRVIRALHERTLRLERSRRK